MNYDLEIAAALAANPALTRPPPPPPPGISEIAHGRQLANVTFAPFVKWYSERLPDASQYIVSDKLVSVEGGEIIVRYVRPVGEDGGTFPVLVWLHGGGWMRGSIDMDDAHLRTISVELNIAVVNVDYRLAPEHRFPVAIEDSYAAVKWVVEHASELKLDLTKGFLVGGDSAGANMSAAITLKAREDPLFAANPLTGQYLREPAVVHPGAALPEQYKEQIRSFSEFTSTPILNTENMLRFIDVYAPSPPTAADDVRVSPLLANSHAGLPPAFIQVQELDPLRDEGILYENVLRQAGGSTKLIQYPGCFHAFHYCFPAITAAIQLDCDAREGIKWLLTQSPGGRIAGTV
ncbi:alpha/beta-hydrolase [Polyporus arcularius HHB13444]|uniref:Alpha/beta-hydrolase n=1 Tax=Polyporus arcularius HHB13444 TaxID=1314778 RepID=A0A5C3PPI1_9APHY|nr:alpha/beta-hydrolase [Polyporus arcularius HHB13444]